MKLRTWSMVAAAGLLLAACGKSRSEKQITELQRKEAAHLASEAQFAHTLRDYAREEGVLAKVVELCPDTGGYWINLGVARMRMGNRVRAREAYQSALQAYQAE